MPNKNIEDTYLQEKSKTIERSNFVVLSGCSGGGKSTLLTELAHRGHQVIPEPGRQIVKEQEAIGGKGLPWDNLDHFLELALSRYLLQFNSQKERDKFVFFDRGIIDALQLSLKQGDHFKKAAQKFRYNKVVFMLPPWPELYKNDAERKHNYQNALKEYEELMIKYKSFGYQVVLVPKIGVKERADFILSFIG